MDDGQPKLVKLESYRAPEYTTDKTSLDFDIRDGKTRVSCQLLIRRIDAGASEIYLNGEELELVSVALDGRLLSDNEYAVDNYGLTVFDLGESHILEIVTDIRPEQNTALEGLYRSSSMYCTQCEAEGFRKITYYQDRPDVLSTFTTTVTANSELYPNLLSNGNLIHDELDDDGRKSVTWDDPFPKPSYLFALVAGNLSVLEDEYTTLSGRRINLKIFSEPHNIDQCSYAMDALKRSMRWDEESFGREYDLDVFMIVAVEDFNMGAMENKGLNIFNTSCVLASPDTATDQAYQRVEAVVAHEYFHNWSGNRVTCRDWFQLSLKEGFTVFRDALFSGDMNSHSVKRIEDVGLLRAVQFAEDAGPLAHAVRPSSYIEISNFYTPTIYEKGAEVVRMYRTLLGEEDFRKGTDLYFERFDGTAATTDDFTSVMEEVGNVDLGQFKRWYEQAGTPVLHITESYENGTLFLNISQSCPSTPGQLVKEPFHVPVEIGLIEENGSPICFDNLEVTTEAACERRKDGQSMLLSLKSKETVIEIGRFVKKPIVSFLREFTAPVKVEYTRPLGELSFLARKDTDGFVRWDSLQSLWVKYFDSEISLHDLDVLGVVEDIASTALGHDLDSEEKHLSANMLVLPGENYFFEQLSIFDVDILVDKREKLLDEIANQFDSLWYELYQKYWSNGSFSHDSSSMADRALANVAFQYVSRGLVGKDLSSFVQSHYTKANNLTDRKSALTVVCGSSEIEPGVRREVLEDFFEKWKSEALVLDLWFSVQAQSSLYTIEDLKILESHEKFDRKNPNRVRSLFSSFSMSNHLQFHSLDGSGYRYLGEAIAILDASNPQLAARLSGPLTRWARYDKERQGLMTDVLGRIASEKGISKDVFEIVSKSLDSVP